MTADLLTLVALGVGAKAGVAWGIVAFLLQGPFAFAALAVGERRQQAWETVRRYFLRRSVRPRLEALRARQRHLATRLRDFYTRVAATGTAG